MLKKILVLMFLAYPTYAKVLPATPSDIASVIANASGGDTVELATGQYQKVIISNRKFNTPLIIKNREGAKPVVLQLVLNNDAGITIAGLTLVSPTHELKGYPSAKCKANPLNLPDHPYGFSCLNSNYTVIAVNNSDSVTVNNCDLSSDDVDPITHQNGVTFTDVKNLTLTNNRFHNLYNAIVAIERMSDVDIRAGNLSNKNIIVKGNEFYEVSNDDMDIRGVDTALIDGNFDHLQAGLSSLLIEKMANHSDFLQIIANPDPKVPNVFIPVRNITITNNIVLKSIGHYCNNISVTGNKTVGYECTAGRQSNLLANAGRYANTSPIFLENFIIKNNLYSGGDYDQIALGGMKNIVVENNTVAMLNSNVKPSVVGVASPVNNSQKQLLASKNSPVYARYLPIVSNSFPAGIIFRRVENIIYSNNISDEIKPPVDSVDGSLASTPLAASTTSKTSTNNISLGEKYHNAFYADYNSNAMSMRKLHFKDWQDTKIIRGVTTVAQIVDDLSPPLNASAARKLAGFKPNEVTEKWNAYVVDPK